jgi:hypothetical protein
MIIKNILYGDSTQVERLIFGQICGPHQPCRLLTTLRGHFYNLRLANWCQTILVRNPQWKMVFGIILVVLGGEVL